MLRVVLVVLLLLLILRLLCLLDYYVQRTQAPQPLHLGYFCDAQDDTLSSGTETLTMRISLS